MTTITSNGDRLFDLLKRIAALRRAPKTRRGKYHAGRSPYKPVLLLTVLRRVQQGKKPYVANRIKYRDSSSDFATVYSRLYGESEEVGSKVAQAFWYLGAGSPRIWDLKPRSGKEPELSNLISEHAQIKTANKLNEFVDSASLAEDDWALVADRDVQGALISFIISEHFPDVRREIERL